MSYDEQAVVMRIRRLTVRDLRDWVEAGWVLPAQGSAGPVYDDLDVARLELICELRKDLSMPVDAMPVVLSLLDRLHATRRQLRTLSLAVDRQPDTLRQAVLTACRSMLED
ncbi:MAG: MerR family transcriptional regulator [Pseudooceanicola sp.]|nr:MerR family transcriptional regulator [Pseudooceanicola sp.]